LLHNEAAQARLQGCAGWNSAAVHPALLSCSDVHDSSIGETKGTSAIRTVQPR